MENNNINTIAQKTGIFCSPVSGYKENNPNNIILDFENELLDAVAGAKANDYQCVITDSATNAIESVVYLNQFRNKKIRYNIPKNTYHSVYQAIKSIPGTQVTIKKIKWEYKYELGNIVDSAAYFPHGDIDTLFTEGIDYVILSFGNQKPLSMNRGGAIIFKANQNIDNKLRVDTYNFLKRYTHNGRDSAIPVKGDLLLKVSTTNYKYELIGRRFNLVPEQVQLGLDNLRANKIKSNEETKKTYKDFKSLTQVIWEDHL